MPRTAPKPSAAPAEDAHDHVEVRPADGNGGLTLAIVGSLSIKTLAEAWPKAVDPVRQKKPKAVTIDAGELDYCDGAGLGLFAELRRDLAGWGGELRFDNLKPDLQRLVDMAALSDPAAPQLDPPRRPDVVTAVGMSSGTVLTEMAAIVTFLGESIVALFWAIAHPRQLRWKDFFISADKVGTDALPVICLLGFLIGEILAFQAAPALERYGIRDTIPTLVSISLVRELGPLIATLLLAGRTASAFAAELGTMKVTEEINALRSMGLNPVRFLVVPRVLAATITSPMLALFSTVCGVLGGYSVMASYGFSLGRYLNQVKAAVTYRDFIEGEVKTVVFGLIVGGIGCLRGLRTAEGPGAVGDSTTRAVVTSIVLIIIADGIFGVVFYAIGL